MFPFRKFPWAIASKPSPESVPAEALAPECPPPSESPSPATPTGPRITTLVRRRVGTFEAVINADVNRVLDTLSRALIRHNVSEAVRTAILQDCLRTGAAGPRGPCRGGKCGRC